MLVKRNRGEEGERRRRGEGKERGGEETRKGGERKRGEIGREERENFTSSSWA